MELGGGEEMAHVGLVSFFMVTYSRHNVVEMHQCLVVPPDASQCLVPANGKTDGQCNSDSDDIITGNSEATFLS